MEKATPDPELDDRCTSVILMEYLVPCVHISIEGEEKVDNVQTATATGCYEGGALVLYGVKIMA